MIEIEVGNKYRFKMDLFSRYVGSCEPCFKCILSDENGNPLRNLNSTEYLFVIGHVIDICIDVSIIDIRLGSYMYA